MQETTSMIDLPSELRVAIFEYVYAGPSDNTVIQLQHALPPSKSILLTCTQFYQEARELYNTAYRTFWTKSEFHLHVDTVPASHADRDLLLSLRAEDLNRITSLRIQVPDADMSHLGLNNDPGYNCATMVMMDNRGGWKVSKTSTLDVKLLHSSDWHYHRARPWLTRESPRHESVIDPTRLAWDGATDEDALRYACAKYSRSGIPVLDQVLYLLQLDFVD